MPAHIPAFLKSTNDGDPLEGIDLAQPFIAVLGPRDADEDTRALALEVGRLIALGGAVVVNGGLTGVMEASAQGASSVGGHALGLLPGDTKSAGNRFLTHSKPTGQGEYRNAMIIEAADAAVSVGFNWGTLSELALAVATGKPTASLRPWQIIDGEGRTPVGLNRFTSPQEACSHIFTRLASV